MLNQIQPEKILFLDIETVPQAQDYSLLKPEAQQLWAEKSKYICERQSITTEQSYAQAGIYAEFGKIICISVGYFTKSGTPSTFRVTSFCGDDERQILLDFAQLLSERHHHPFQRLCAHNGKEFDFPYLSRRMLVNRIDLPEMLDLAGKKPWEIAHLDTMELWKFGDIKHYTSLKLLAHIFGIPTPKDDIDGSQVRTVYYDEGNLDRIKTYCQKDVITVAQLFLSYRGAPLIQESDIIIV